jgi:hypothetical protein
MKKLLSAIALCWLAVTLPAGAQSPAPSLPEVVKRVRGAVVVIRTSGHAIARGSSPPTRPPMSRC